MKLFFFFKRRFSSIKSIFNSPPKQHAFVSLPLQSRILGYETQFRQNLEELGRSQSRVDLEQSIMWIEIKLLLIERSLWEVDSLIMDRMRKVWLKRKQDYLVKMVRMNLDETGDYWNEEFRKLDFKQKKTIQEETKKNKGLLLIERFFKQDLAVDKVIWQLIQLAAIIRSPYLLINKVYVLPKFRLRKSLEEQERKQLILMKKLEEIEWVLLKIEVNLVLIQRERELWSLEELTSLQVRERLLLKRHFLKNWGFNYFVSHMTELIKQGFQERLILDLTEKFRQGEITFLYYNKIVSHYYRETIHRNNLWERMMSST